MLHRESLWFALTSELSYVPDMDNALLNQFHVPSFIFGNILRMIFWVILSYLLFIKGNKGQWKLVGAWLKRFFKFDQSDKAEWEAKLPKQKRWQLFGQLLFVMLVLIFWVGGAVVSLNNYARLTQSKVISTHRRATIVMTNAEASHSSKSNYGRIFFLIEMYQGYPHFVNISNANKHLVNQINDTEEQVKVTVSLNDQGKIVQVNYPIHDK